MNFNKTKIALACKLMPLYRLGVFKSLTAYNEEFEFTFLGDTVRQGGIEIIPWEYANRADGIRWIKTNNYFYKPELLLWQTGIIRRILFEDYKCYVFEGAVTHLPTWLFALLCKLFNRKVLFWTHGFRGTDKGLRRLIRIFYYKYFADGLLLYGHYSRNLMIENGFDPQKVFVIYNSLDSKAQFSIYNNQNLDVVKSKKSNIFLKPDNFTLIFIGRLVSGKKIMELLWACNEIIKKQIEINCIIIGDGPEKEKINKYVESKGIGSYIHLTGSLYSEEEICTYFMMSDLMVSPGNVGLNCIHSLAYGVPVLTHDNFVYQNPEVEAIIPFETGLFYKYDDLNDMVEQILSWKNQEKTRSAILDVCQDKIKSLYNSENQTKCIVDAINKIL